MTRVRVPHTCSHVWDWIRTVYCGWVPRNLKRYYGAGDLHFVTFNYYRRLPPLLRALAQWLPITHALAGMRRAVLEGASVGALAPQLQALALFAIIGLPLSIFLFYAGMKWTRTAGSLGHF